MRATVFIGTSLDGFIAREDGGIDWLIDDEYSAPGEDYGYAPFFETVDALVLGRNSYELVRTFPEWPYGTKPVVVLTSRPLEIPDELRETVSTLGGAPQAIVAALEERGIEHIYLDGGMTVQRFLAEGLVQRMIITRVPVLIGRGIPLFGDLPHDVKLRHVRTQTYPTGLVQSEYEIVS